MERRTLRVQMSAVDSSNLRDFLKVNEDNGDRLAELSPGAALSQKRESPANRTLLDIIKTEEPKTGGYKHTIGKDKRSWKTFKDKLHLRRAGSAWTSILPIPACDVPVQNPPPQFGRRESQGFQNSPSMAARESGPEIPPAEDSTAPDPAPSFKPHISRRTSVRVNTAPEESSESNPDARFIAQPAARPQFGLHNSLRFQLSNSTLNRANTTSVARHTDDTDSNDSVQNRRLSAVLNEERQLSAREAAAAQEAAEAEAGTAAAEPSEEEEAATVPATEPVRMSLMDLLDETDRQMGIVGSSYCMGDEENEFDEEDGDNGKTLERTCCVCMVRHKGAALIPCGHTFCRLCSRELWVSRGSCPLCNAFILEILDIF